LLTIVLINRFANGIRLPNSILHHPFTSALLDQITIQLWHVNDLLSLRNEINENQISLIPILYASSSNLQDAVDACFSEIHEAGRKFEVLADQLKENCKDEDDEEGAKEAVEHFVLGCRYAYTGYVNWGVSSGRYGMQDAVTDKGMLLKV
jgi:hypothetical protein